MTGLKNVMAVVVVVRKGVDPGCMFSGDFLGWVTNMECKTRKKEAIDSAIPRELGDKVAVVGYLV